MLRDTFAGVAIGASVGLMVGLSVSPITGMVVTTLLSVLVAYLGLGGQAGPLTSGIASTRVVGFCLGLAPALLLSLTLRTHDGLSPSPRDLVERWKEAGFSQTQAMDLAVLERFGSIPFSPVRTSVQAIKPSEQGPKPEAPRDESPSAGAHPKGISVESDPMRSILFGQTGPAWRLDCEALRASRFESVEDRLEAMSSRSLWGDVVATTRRLQGPGAQAAFLEDQWRAKCGD